MNQAQTARPFHAKAGDKTLYTFRVIYRKPLSLVHQLDYTMGMIIRLTTDMHRLPAIRLYLRRMPLPGHASLYSYIQWRITLKKLGDLTC